MLSNVIFRRAHVEDLKSITDLLTDDPLGQTREQSDSGISQCYLDAFKALEGDANQFLAVGEVEGRIIATLQLTFIPGLSRSGAWRGQIEAVRVARDLRSQGIGRQFFEWAIEQCRQRGCKLVQLTSDKTRVEAQNFYGNLGFTDSHVGYKLNL